MQPIGGVWLFADCLALELLVEELSESTESSNDSTESAVDLYESFQLPCSEALHV